MAEQTMGILEPQLPAPDLPSGPSLTPGQINRRRVLAGLMTLTLAFLLFAAWYLVTRKPVSELLPPFGLERVPGYAFSLEGVTAPMGVAVSPDGSRVYVTQSEGEGGLVMFDGTGAKLGTITPPAETGLDHVPVYVAVDPGSGDVYVSDRPAGAIYVYSRDGVFLRTFDPGTELGAWQPLGLAFDGHGDLWVTDLGGDVDSVHEFGPDGVLMRTLTAADGFTFPNGVAVDSKDYVYVTDSNNGRLVIFDPDGRQVSVVRRGAQENALGLPRGIAIDGSDRLYVVDTTAQGVQLYKTLADGERVPSFVGRFGAEGIADGGFQYPNGVAVDARSRVYVTDTRNDRVQVWTY